MIAQQPPSALTALNGLREPPGDIPGPEVWGLLLCMAVVVLIISYTKGTSERRGPTHGRAATLRRRRIVDTGTMVLALAVAAAPAVLAAVTRAVSA
jgi:hypothetical protein